MWPRYPLEPAAWRQNCARFSRMFSISLCMFARLRAFRIFQVRKTGNRHLVDIRSANSFPKSKRLDGVLVLPPAELIASKIVSYHQRRGQPKAGTDWRDL